MAFEPITWNLRTRSLTTADHTLVMGILNVTPDSFSDGGRWLDADAAVDRARKLAALGADVIDVGGESTRPGSVPVDAVEERARILPVIEALSSEGFVASIDTSKPSVARAAIDAGAEIVNDVTGLSDPAMIEICSESGVGVVIMHMLGDPRTMQIKPSYEDVVADIAEFLESRVDMVVEAGVDVSGVAVAVEMKHGGPERFRVQLDVTAAALHRRRHVELPVARDRHSDGLTCKTVDMPQFFTRGRFVPIHTPVAEHHQLSSAFVFPDHRTGPGASIVGSRRFPSRFSRRFIKGDDFGPAQTAALQVCIVVQNQDEPPPVQDR